MKYFLAIALLFFIVNPAQAGHHHYHYQHHVHYAHRHHQVVVAQPATCDNMFCMFNGGVLPQSATRYSGRSHWASTRPARALQAVSYGSTSSFDSAVGRPSRHIAGRLTCALNVGAALAERGIRGTGSALALSYLHWGRSAGGPVPGAVIVSSRRGGGHVAIVSRVQNGVTYAWNSSGRGGWREIAYPLRVLDYRVPG
jgi:hypothetical protein